jgi:outer membrane protein OmpA-like peptidoglycan-associated protein
MVALALAPTASRANARLEADRIEPGGTVYFETGSARITPESFRTLDAVAALLRANPSVTIEVQVHTDSTGMDAWNLRLSSARAGAIVEYLAQMGVPLGRMSAQGYGETCPIAPNTTAAGRAANRRVVFYRTDANMPRSCPPPPPAPPPESYDPSSQFPDPADAVRQQQ